MSSPIPFGLITQRPKRGSWSQQTELYVLSPLYIQVPNILKEREGDCKTSVPED